MNDLTEKRKSKRWDLKRYLKVYDHNADVLIGYLADITLKGLKLFSTYQIAAQQEYTIRIIILSDQIYLKAFCLWCKLDDSSDLYVSGWQITNLSPAACAGVSCLIEVLKTGSIN